LNVILGLGNPGHSYHGTRHNIGFAVIQALAERHKVDVRNPAMSPRDGRPASVSGDCALDGTPVRLMMPLTMMNESGEAVRTVESPAESLLIVCDDVNLPLGSLRLRPGGSAGGHHGLQSCLEALGHENVPRLRLGVGAKDMPRDLQEFVLGPFRSGERPAMQEMLAQAVEACEAWVRDGIEAAMNRYNRAVEG
jgi:PTH1 family peptidyl-tRNA hydrolase